eukprot:TRINITY_DN5740_c0_g1_i1.p1 TRINITY_DN5740_c0_g1~~TRINITY_DN5740_c0_g1_i1.p1  ORF type:complete len:304 (-),score=36.06 TRINITY_DN5740_c0_g1_i1:36-947(-)
MLRFLAKHPQSTFLSYLSLASNGHIKAHKHIDYGELTMDKMIGTGATAQVRKATWNGKEVAVKIFREEMVSMQELRLEVALLSLLDQEPSVLYCLGACVSGDHYFVVTEYFERGSLFKVLYGGGREEKIDDSNTVPQVGPLFTMAQSCKMARDCAIGMEVIHSINVCHRDLKSDNLLVRDDSSLCIADFGISRLVGKDMTRAMGTPRYMAPEVMSGAEYGTKADVYSFAIIWWELITQTHPFNNLPNPWQVTGAVMGGARPPVNPAWPAALRSLLISCWDADPKVRPTFKVIHARLDGLLRSL